MFKDLLKEGLRRAGMSAADLSRATGVSSASVCQYLKGVAEPRKDKRDAILQALGIKEVTPEMDPFAVSVEDVAKVMHMEPSTIRAGLRQGVFGWGYAIELGVNEKGRTNWAYKINRLRFAEIEHVEV